MQGLCRCQNTGNVIRPWTSVKVSIRLPPTADAGNATAAVKQLLEKVIDSVIERREAHFFIGFA